MSIEGSEIKLWLSVLERAVLDANALFASFSRKKDVIECKFFLHDVLTLRSWFRSKSHEVGRLAWICSYVDMDPGILARRIERDCFAPILAERANRYDAVNQKQIECRRKQIEREQIDQQIRHENELIEKRKLLINVLKNRILKLEKRRIATDKRRRRYHKCDLKPGEVFGAWTVESIHEEVSTVSRYQKYNCICICGRREIRANRQIKSIASYSECSCKKLLAAQKSSDTRKRNSLNSIGL